jgi:FkbH-like protein
MKLSEALQLVQSAGTAAGAPYEVVLGCGFTPLHLETFLGAHLTRRLPGRAIRVRTGLYGDLAGTLEAAATGERLDGVAIALEWADLDPRLGFRSAGAWTDPADLVSSARGTLARLATAIEALPPSVPVALSLPTLELPPLFHTPGWQWSQRALELERSALDFALALSGRRPRTFIPPPGSLAALSPPAGRYDFRSDLQTGLPYKLSHADAVAQALARLLAPPAPKKGLITDLDDTLWSGIVGDAGPENVAWDLSNHQMAHGLYQKLLASFASEGVLLAVASKNDPAIANQALEREDLLLAARHLFPREISWGPKSAAVERILKIWNISADSVVFVDDSPMELAEVAARHPEIECMAFPKNDLPAVRELLVNLRDRFGKPRLSEEDALRLDTIRANAAFASSATEQATPEDFLSRAEAAMTFDFSVAPDERALELVNKTNQFNLNGQRWTAAEWQAGLERPAAFTATVSYRDRFGPLGKISVLAGRRENDDLVLETWVLSCRAFARRIEYQSLRVLFDRFDCAAIRFSFAPTPKNGPLQEFLADLLPVKPKAGEEPGLSRQDFAARCPPLHHHTTVIPEV